MVKRQEGRREKKQNVRPKKKSIRAKITSVTSGKRKLSRFGKQQKKGLIGPSTDYVTRSAALKRLQVTLKDFRRLCILKGIYPRVPAKAPKGSDKVYYDIKDLVYLSHEPLLEKFREFKSFMKKIRKAAGRKEFSEARRRDELKPIMHLDHLVKERYPRFIDALRDLDDSLCMIFLFAAMPSDGRVTAPKTLACAELCRHWLYYVAKSRCLHKVFASVKGFYYQVEVMGEQITWLVPHQFTQTVPKEVDLRVMTTFLDFYEVFVRFVLYKLYNMMGLRYPPVEDKKLLDAGSCLLAVKAARVDGEGGAVEASAGDDNSSGAAASNTIASSSSQKGKAGKNAEKQQQMSAAHLASLQAKLKDIEEEGLDDEDDDGDEDCVKIAAPLTAAFAGLQDGDDDEDNDAGEQESRRTFAQAEGEQDRRTRLFSKLRFFLSREVPMDWLQVCVLSFGAQLGWDGPTSPFSASDPGITHYVMDRPMQASMAQTGREYVQPQWVFDCINAQFLLPTSKYRPGAALPPHLSPFVDDDKEGHVPTYRKEILGIVGTDDAASGGGGDKRKANKGSSSSSSSTKEQLDESDGESEDGDAAARRYAREVRAERGGVSFSDAKAKVCANANANANAKANVKESDGGKSSGSNKGEKRSRGDDSDNSNDSDDSDDSDDSNDSNDSNDSDEEEEEPVPSSKPVKGPKGVVFKPLEKSMTEDEEAHELAKTMMGKKTKRLYGRMQHGLQAKSDHTQRLADKQKALEDSKGQKDKARGGGGGKDKKPAKAAGTKPPPTKMPKKP